MGKNSYRIYTDAAADLNPALLEGLPEVEVIPMEVEFGAKSYTCGPGGNITAQKFYAIQRSGPYAGTSQINPSTYRAHFERALKRGEDLIYLCFSTGLSGTLNNALICIEDLQRQYPDRRMYAVDTLCASAGEGFLVREAARMQASGMDMDDLVEWVARNRLKVCHWFTVDSFDHLKHGGRLSSAAAAFGNVLNIKPLIRVDDAGELRVVRKLRGRHRAMKALLERVEQGWEPQRGELIVVGHGDSAQAAAALAEAVRGKCPNAEIVTTEIGPVIGAHTGPGMLALVYWGGNR